jgi:hypothetical protein
MVPQIEAENNSDHLFSVIVSDDQTGPQANDSLSSGTSDTSATRPEDWQLAASESQKVTLIGCA